MEALSWETTTRWRSNQLLFQRKSKRERLFVAVNAADAVHLPLLDAGGCRTITGEDRDFGGGEVAPFSAHLYLRALADAVCRLVLLTGGACVRLALACGRRVIAGEAPLVRSVSVGF